MASFIRTVLEEMFEYSRYDEISTLYQRLYDTDTNYLQENARKEFIVWVEEQFDLANVPKGAFRNIIMASDIIYNTDNQDEFLDEIKANYCALEDCFNQT